MAAAETGGLISLSFIKGGRLKAIRRIGCNTSGLGELKRATAFEDVTEAVLCGFADSGRFEEDLLRVGINPVIADRMDYLSEI